MSKEPERAPWYTITGRIITFLGLTLFFYGIELAWIKLLIIFYDKILGLKLYYQLSIAIQTHPAIAIVILIVGYIANTCWVINKTADMLLKRHG